MNSEEESILQYKWHALQRRCDVVTREGGNVQREVNERVDLRIVRKNPICSTIASIGMLSKDVVTLFRRNVVT